MSKRTQGMNKHQKAAHKRGEERVGKEEIEELLGLSRSHDPEDRLLAASYFCPCHVRHRNEEVWEALYRMMEDPVVKVRRQAWHTLEDGGCPSDPAFEPILKRTLASEKDRQVLGFANMFSKPVIEIDDVAIKIAGRPEKKQRGKCDFCGETNVFVKPDYDTEIPTGDMLRAAWVCGKCE